MSRITIRSSLAALSFVVAATGFSGVAVAAHHAETSPSQTTQREGKHGSHHHHHHRDHDRKHGDRRGASEWHGAFMIPGVGPLSKKQVESLKLDQKQQSAFDAAKKAQQDLLSAMKADGGKRHELLAKQLGEGKLDPRALIAEQSTHRQAWQAQSEQVRNQWLAAWDALSPAQHQQVTDWVKAHQAKKDERRDKKQERHAKHGDKSIDTSANTSN